MAKAHQLDEYWMAKALKLAAKGRFTTTPNPNVGCVLVKDDQLIGEGYHQKAGTAHAEIHALDQAGDDARGSTAYVTLEPCSHFGKTPPCADALIKAGVSRVVCAMLDPNPLVSGQGLARLRDSGLETRHGVLADEAEKLNPGFLKRMRTGKPLVIVKMASSLDGGTAMASGESQWITGPDARADVQKWRAECCAILTGVDTVIADDPSLNVRLDGLERQPVRIVLDSQGRIPLNSKMLQLPGRTVVLHGDTLAGKQVQAISRAGYDTAAIELNQTRLDLNAVIKWAAEQQFNTVWIEAGATLAGAFLEAGLVDEVILYQAPKFLGANARPVVATQFETLAQSLEFSVKDIRSVGRDVRWRLEPIRQNSPK